MASSQRTRGVDEKEIWLLPCALLALASLAGCRSLPSPPPVNFSEPGWTIRQGQGVWHAKRNASGLAGELLVALNLDGRSVVQLTKPPLPFIEAQRTTNSWRLQLFAQHKQYSGRDRPPNRILWLQLPDALAGRQLEKDWRFTQSGADAWHFENLVTEETLDGFLVATRLPPTHLVQPGETLGCIARWYGVTADSIQAANPGPTSAWLKAGNRINLP